MRKNNKKAHSKILKISLEMLSDCFKTELEISNVVFLSEPERRNVILRLFLRGKSSIPQSVILKQSLPEETDADDEDAYARFSRDWAGLQFASNIPQRIHNVPKF